MSMFENNRYRWRETYFVLFSSSRRPTLKALHQVLARLDEDLTMTNLVSDDAGRFESLTVLAPDDFAALDLCYLEGEEITEQIKEMAAQLDSPCCEERLKEEFERIQTCDARIDVLHFEQVVDRQAMDMEEGDEVLDPSALLLVLDALAELTGGTAIDPQGGAIL